MRADISMSLKIYNVHTLHTSLVKIHAEGLYLKSENIEQISATSNNIIVCSLPGLTDCSVLSGHLPCS